MKILIFELWSSGHRFQYVRSIIDSIYEINNDITLITMNDSVKSIEFKMHLEEIQEKFKIELLYPKYKHNGLMSLWEFGGLLISVIEKYQPERVYIPTANGILQIFGLKRLFQFYKIPNNTKLEVMLMSGGVFSGWKKILLEFCWGIATKLARCEVIHVLYPLQEKTYKSYIVSITDEILLTPEPVENNRLISKDSARKILGLPVSGKYIVSIGYSDRRKGTDLLLKAFCNTKFHENDRLLLAGKLDNEIKGLIDSKYIEMVRKKKIIILDNYLSQDDFMAVFCAADIICLPYRYSESSSGIAVRAAAIGKLILSSNTGWVGRTIQDFELGLTCDVFDEESFSNYLLKSLSFCESYQLTEKGNFFVKYHTMENFKAHWGKKLRERLGLMPDSNFIAWKEG